MQPQEIARHLAELHYEQMRTVSNPYQSMKGICDGVMRVSPQSDGYYPSQNANKIQHIGTGGLAKREALLEAMEEYRSVGVPRFFVYVSPSPQKQEIIAWLESEGLSETVQESVLVRKAARCIAPKAIAVSAEDERLHKVLREGFETDYIKNMVAVLQTPCTRSFLALAEHEPAATGALQMLPNAQLAYLGWACTVPQFRRRGLHHGLILFRTDAAASNGADFVTAVTYDFTGSFSNLIRCGFAEAYRTHIYRWERN